MVGIMMVLEHVSKHVRILLHCWEHITVATRVSQIRSITRILETAFHSVPKSGLRQTQIVFARNAVT